MQRRMKRLLMNGQDLEGNGRDLIKVLSRYLPGNTKENHERPQ
jgi:hypothetical protein